jgi:hypothetical protein
MVRYRKNRSGTTPCTGRRKRVRSNNKRSITTGHPYPTTTHLFGQRATNKQHPLPVTRIDSDPKNGPGTRDVPTVIRTTGRIRNCDDACMLSVLHHKTTGVNRSKKQEWARSVDNIPNIKGAGPIVPVKETTVPGLCHPHVIIAG